MTKTVLVTGGAGFIGSNLVRRLIAHGHTPVVLDDLSTGLAENLADVTVDLRVASITDLAAVKDCARGADAIVHLAARGSVPRSVKEPLATHEVNATGTLNVLEAARSEGAYMVFASSSSVYGLNRSLPKSEQMWTAPMSPYGASKLAAEAYVNAFGHSYALNTLALRFFNVYGPWQRADHDYAAVIPRFVSLALQRGRIPVHGDGEQSRDFTHVSTVVDVLVDAIERRVSNPTPVNLAYGTKISINELIRLIEKMAGVPLEVAHLEARVGDVRDSQNSPASLQSLFPGIEPVDLNEGLASVFEWMRSDPAFAHTLLEC